MRGDGLLPEEAGGGGGEGSRLGGAGVGVHLGGETQDPHVVPHTDLGRPGQWRVSIMYRSVQMVLCCGQNRIKDIQCNV